MVRIKKATHKTVSKQYSFCTSSSLENEELLCLSKVCMFISMVLPVLKMPQAGEVKVRCCP